jgi:SAM-dependent methyltransferase
VASSGNAAREAYRAYMARVYREEFGITDSGVHHAVADDWFFCDARHDPHFEAMRARLPGATRFLDLASGMGSTVLRGLQQGLDGFGIEPDPEKLSLMRERIEAGVLEQGWDPAWRGRFARAVGETLPFRARSFDVILSYQTLEHVRDPAAVIAEMLRVVRPGGALHLRCPDYSGAFEGHYLLPWLPLLPRPLARAWLRLRGRPVTGFEGIRYTTPRQLVRLVRQAAERAGIRTVVTNLERERYQSRLREKGMPGWRGPALPWRALYYARRMFRVELQANLWVSVEER